MLQNSNVQMTLQERSRLEELDSISRSGIVREQISPVVLRVRTELGWKPQALMTWEPIPLEVFGGALPTEIRSSWIFVLRAGADTGAERHPNSHQRMMSLQGSGDMRIEEEGNWRSNLLISEPAAPLEQRWIRFRQVNHSILSTNICKCDTYDESLTSDKIGIDT